MFMPRLLAALFAPAGVVAAHALAYTAAHGWEHERQTVLSGHGPFTLLAGLALPLCLVALVVVVASDGRWRLPRWREFCAVQAPLLVAVEVIERVTAFEPLVELLHDPAAWAALALQSAAAAVFVRAVRAVEGLGPTLHLDTTSVPTARAPGWAAPPVDGIRSGAIVVRPGRAPPLAVLARS
jgi:hypothetical protein